MIDVNLLPWREEQRAENLRHYLVSLVAVALATMIIAVGVHYYYIAQIENQNSRNQYLKSQVALFQKQIQEIATLKKSREALVSRMRVIQGLQAQRPFSVKVFDELVKIIPDGLFIQSIAKQGNAVTITGSAESNTNISDLMRNINKSKLFHNPQLAGIDEKSLGEFKRSFSMRMNIKR